MGMVATIEQVTPQQLAAFIRNPRKAYDFRFDHDFDNPDLEPFVALLAEKAKSVPPGFRAEIERVTGRVQAKIRERKGLRLVVSNGERHDDPPEHKRFSLEKDWHVLHYVLNGTTEGGQGPLADAIFGGDELPDLDNRMSFGPICYLTPERVIALARALAQVNPDSLLAKLNREDALAKQIYLAHTLTEGWEYLPDFFRSFRAFYEDAARHGNAVLRDLC